MGQLAAATVKSQQSLPSMFASRQPYTKAGNKYKMITKSIAEFLIIDMKPLSTVDGGGFTNMVKMMDPLYQMPSRNHVLEQYIVPMYQETLARVKSEIATQGVRHAFTTDAWTSGATEGYVTYTCHFINVTSFKLESRVLDTKRTQESHTGANLCADMKETVEKWGLREPVATTDNAANIVLGCRLADYPHVGCFAHSLNLVLNEGLKIKEISSLLGKCRKIVSVFKYSDQKNLQLQRAEEALALKQLRVLQDVATRWNSAFAMVCRLLVIMPAVMSVLCQTTKTLHLSPSVTDIQNMKSLECLLKPFDFVTKMVSSERKPTSSMILPTIAKLERGLVEQEGDSGMLKKAKRVMLARLQALYQLPQTRHLLGMASALDPKFKELAWLEEGVRETIRSAVRTEAAAGSVVMPGLSSAGVVVKVEPIEDSSPTTSTPPTEPDVQVQEQVPMQGSPSLPSLPTLSPAKKPRSDEDSFFDDVVFMREEPAPIQSSEARARLEMERYCAEPPCPMDGDSLEWWQARRPAYPLLSSLAARYLGIPATSVPSERVFSCAGNLVTKKRAALRPDNVEMLLFLHYNYKLSL